MNRRTTLHLAAFSTVAVLASVAGCAGQVNPPDGGGTGGVLASGGALPSSGGAIGSGGAGSGGLASSGGASSGGASSGGASSGGASSGGTGSGGVTSSGGTTSSGGCGPIGSGGTSGSGSTTGSGGDPTIDPTFETFKYVVEQANCDSSDCHGNNEANPLNLVDRPELHDHLTAEVSESCGNLPIVDPSNPDGSALVLLLKGPCGCTERMPKGCFENEFENNCVPDNYIAAIEAWVLAGALP